MSTRKIAIGVVLGILGLPVVLALVATASFYALMSSYAPNRTNGSIRSSGQEREYLLYVPRSYDPTRPTPLVVSLHGAALWPATQMAATGWNALAEAHGFLVVYPSGTTLRGAGTSALPFRVWHLGPDPVSSANGRFIADLIDTLAATYNVDPNRIYANGLSNGGRMVFGLSCTLADRLAAVGTVAAAQDTPLSWCARARPVPLINVHGTADPLVPYEGGRKLVSPRPFTAVSTWTANWARRNQCAPVPVASAVAEDVTRLEYTACAADAAVVLYSVRGGGHAWPGGKPFPAWLVGRTTRSIDATSLMWDFFRQHPLRRN